MKLFELLIESRIDFLKDKYVKIIMDKYDQNIHSARITFMDFELTDPTPNKIYLQWLLRSATNLNKQLFIRFIVEDFDKFREYLKIYDKVKPKLPIEQRDINKLSLDQLKGIALQYKEKEEEVLTKNDYLDKKYKINETEEFLIYMFKNNSEQDFKMYQLVSTNTEWCTRPDYKKFKNYINKSPLFVFIDKQNRNLKYQFHEQSNQFMDAADKRINIELKLKLISLISDYLPEDFRIQFGPYGDRGIINKNGEIIARGFLNINSFFEGFAKVVFMNPRNSFGFINKDGKIIVKGLRYAESFTNGLARVGFKNMKYGHMSKDLKFYENNKKTLIPKDDPRLKGIELFPENLN